MQDTRRRIQDTRRRMQDAGYRMQDRVVQYNLREEEEDAEL